MHNSDKAIAEKDFFKNNKAAFDRWNIEWSDRTAALLNKAGAELNRSAVIDFFNGVVGEKVARQGALTAAWANDTVFLGQEGYDAAKMQYSALYPVSETKYEGKGVQDSSFVLVPSARFFTHNSPAVRHFVSQIF